MNSIKVLKYLDSLKSEGEAVLKTKTVNYLTIKGSRGEETKKPMGYIVNKDMYIAWKSKIERLLSSLIIFRKQNEIFKSVEDKRWSDLYDISLEYYELIKSLKDIIELGLIDEDSIDEDTSSDMRNQHIVNNFGNNSQVQIGTKSSLQNQAVYNLEKLNNLISEVEKHKKDLNLSKIEQVYLDEKLNSLKEESEKESPEDKLIEKSKKSLKTIFEGCAGNVAASGLLKLLSGI